MGAGASLDSLDYTPLNTILQLNHRVLKGGVVWKNYQGWLERNYSRNYFLLKMIMYCANKEFILQAMDKLYIQYSGAPQPDMGSIFQIKNPWNILIIETIMWFIKMIKVIKMNCFYSPRTLEEQLKCICSCLQTEPRENWFHMYAENSQLSVPYYLVLLRRWHLFILSRNCSWLYLWTKLFRFFLNFITQSNL